MKTTTDSVAGSRARREGQTFVIVMMLTGILMIAGASLTFLTSNAAFSSRKINNGARALAIAEAGIADRISKMTTNYNGWANASNSASYGGGSYSVVGTRSTNLINVIIRSTGMLGVDRRTVAVELLGTIYMLWDRVVDVEGAIVAGGNVQISNQANIYGDICANGNVETGTGNPLVHGAIQAHGASITIETDPAGQWTPNAPEIVVPDYRETIDLWRARALTDPAYYYTNDQTFTGNPGDLFLAPSSGVVFVEGNVILERKVRINATVVATGWVHVQNQLLGWTSFDTNWPCVIACLDFDCQNQNNYPGTIFAGTTVTIGNRRTINGCIISMQTVSIQNKVDVFASGGPPAWDPNDTNKAAPPIIPGPWLR